MLKYSENRDIYGRPHSLEKFPYFYLIPYTAKPSLIADGYEKWPMILVAGGEQLLVYAWVDITLVRHEQWQKVEVCVLPLHICSTRCTPRSYYANSNFASFGATTWHKHMD